MRRKVAAFISAIMIFVIFTGCGSMEQTEVFAPQSLSDFDAKTIGVLGGSTSDLRLADNFPHAAKALFSSYPDMVLALSQGKIDAAVGDEVTLKAAILDRDNISVYPELLELTDCYFPTAKNETGERIRVQFNGFLSRYSKSGELEKLQELWFYGEESEKPTPELDLPDINGTINVAFYAINNPFEYIRDGEYVGFDVALLSAFCKEFGYRPELMGMRFGALITAVDTGKCDMALGCFESTDERREVVNFTDTTCSIGTAVIYNNGQTVGKSARLKISSVEDLKNCCIGVKTGTTFDALTEQRFPDAQTLYYNNVSDETQALLSGKIDAFLVDLPQARALCQEQPELGYLKSILSPDSYGFAFPKTEKGAALRDQINEYIGRVSADGTLQRLYEKWFGSNETIKVAPDYSALTAKSGMLQYVTDGASEPFDYVVFGDNCGYEIDIIYGFCEEYGYGLEVSSVDFSMIMPSLISGKADLAGASMSITEERMENVYFSTPNYVGGVAVMVRAADIEESKADGFISALTLSFEKTFIRESRWKLVLSGLGVTLLISSFSAVFGTVFGFFLCLIRRSKKRRISRPAAAFIHIIQGVPEVVLLMVLYFVVFAATDINGIVVAIIGFTINFGVYVSEMLRTGIDAVDKGQWEAADALGFGKVKTFQKIVGPQAINHILPVYRGEFISMVKTTSVVGYIAIQDLTQAGDIIRSRTYEAFFPLIVIAIIYFLLAWGLTRLLTFVEISTDPMKRSRKPRGVDMSAPVKPVTSAPKAQTGGDTVISIEHLKKAYENATPLTDVNAKIKRGDVIAVIGPSGTGKSTLLRCLNRLETPTAGKVTVFGTELDGKADEVNAVLLRTGMVFQHFNLFGHLTVLENIMLAPVELKGRTRQEAYETAMRLLRSVGLAEKALNYPQELSGGQQQRVAIARTLAMEPDIILFDEPTSALDPTMVGEVLSVIRKLASDGFTMLIVTHEMKFARDLSTRVFYMDEGVIYEDGAPEELFEHPRRDKTRAFVRRLKVMEKTLTTPDYDFVAVNEAMQSFGEKHQFKNRRIVEMQMVFEELIAQCVIPTLGAAFNLHLAAEYSEESDTLELRFVWAGAECDPLIEGDELSLRLVKPFIRDSEFEYADGTNRLRVVVR